MGAERKKKNLFAFSAGHPHLSQNVAVKGKDVLGIHKLLILYWQFKLYSNQHPKVTNHTGQSTIQYDIGNNCQNEVYEL